MKKQINGFSLIEIIISILLFSILIVIIFPLIYLYTDLSESTALINKSNILLNNSFSMMQVIDSDSISLVNGLYLLNDYNTIDNFPEFNREIYVYNEISPDTKLKKIHIITKYYSFSGDQKQNETYFLRYLYQ